MGVTAGQSSHLNTAKPLQRPGLDKAKATLPIISPIEEVLNQLPSPLTAFTLLDLDVSLITTYRITTYRLTPVGGRLPLFIHNWEILTKDPWVLTTVRGYHLPLCQWPTQGSSSSNLHAGLKKGRSTGRGDFQLGNKRSSGSCQEASSTLDQSSICGSQKRRRVATNYRPTAVKPVYRSSTFQDEGTAHVTISTSAGSPPGQSRPKGCLSHSTDGRRLPAPSSLPKSRGRSLSVQGPTIRTLHCSLRLHKTYKANSSVPSLSQNSDTHLSGRHAHMRTFRTTTTRTTTLNSPLAAGSPRIHSQCTRVSSDPVEADRLLGFTINTSSMTITLPPVKKAEIQRETSRLLRCPSVQTRTLACLLGKLVATRPAVFTAPLHYRALQSLKISALHAQREIVPLSQEAINDLRWWSTQLHLHCSSPILKLEASVVITSDASLRGWGAVCQEETTGGLWTTEEACSHINLLELKAAYLALQCFLKERVSMHVLVRLDNRTAISYLNRMGGPSCVNWHSTYGPGALLARLHSMQSTCPEPRIP